MGFLIPGSRVRITPGVLNFRCERCCGRNSTRYRDCPDLFAPRQISPPQPKVDPAYVSWALEREFSELSWDMERRLVASQETLGVLQLSEGKKEADVAGNMCSGQDLGLRVEQSFVLPAGAGGRCQEAGIIGASHVGCFEETTQKNRCRVGFTV